MKKTNEVSSCYETRISKNALTPPNLSKVNLVILYLNRNLTHQNPLPENILKDSIEILENFKKLS